MNQKDSGGNREGHRPKESLAGRGYALTTDGFGVKGSVLTIDCMIMPGQKGQGRISLLAAVGKSTQDSARIGFNMLRRYISRLNDLDTKIRFVTPVEVGDTSVSGASAGQAILLTMISAIIQEPFNADVCATGTVDVNGRASLVGGIQPKKSAAKLDAARVNGFKICLIPQLAMDELEGHFPDYIRMSKESGCQVIGCRHWFDYARHVFPNILNKATLIERLSKIPVPQ